MQVMNLTEIMVLLNWEIEAPHMLLKILIQWEMTPIVKKTLEKEELYGIIRLF